MAKGKGKGKGNAKRIAGKDEAGARKNSAISAASPVRDARMADTPHPKAEQGTKAQRLGKPLKDEAAPSKTADAPVEPELATADAAEKPQKLVKLIRKPKPSAPDATAPDASRESEAEASRAEVSKAGKRSKVTQKALHAVPSAQPPKADKPPKAGRSEQGHPAKQVAEPQAAKKAGKTAKAKAPASAGKPKQAAKAKPEQSAKAKAKPEQSAKLKAKPAKGAQTAAKAKPVKAEKATTAETPDEAAQGTKTRVKAKAVKAEKPAKAAKADPPAKAGKAAKGAKGAKATESNSPSTDVQAEQTRESNEHERAQSAGLEQTDTASKRGKARRAAKAMQLEDAAGEVSSASATPENLHEVEGAVPEPATEGELAEVADIESGPVSAEREHEASDSAPQEDGAFDDAGAGVEDTAQYLKGLVEAILFVSDRPIELKELARTVKVDRKRCAELLEELNQDYKNRGVYVEEVAGGFAFRTNPLYSSYVRKYLAQRPVRLSRAQLETLAIVAYRQPITKPEVDDIRGVDCGPVLKGLLDRELVRILGKKDEAGRPMLYGTSPQFLELFNLDSLKDLPTLREFTELSEDSRLTYENELGEDAPQGPVELGDSASEGGVASQNADADAGNGDEPISTNHIDAGAAAERTGGQDGTLDASEDEPFGGPTEEGSSRARFEPDPDADEGLGADEIFERGSAEPEADAGGAEVSDADDADDDADDDDADDDDADDDDE